MVFYDNYPQQFIFYEYYSKLESFQQVKRTVYLVTVLNDSLFLYKLIGFSFWIMFYLISSHYLSLTSPL